MTSNETLAEEVAQAIFNKDEQAVIIAIANMFAAFLDIQERQADALHKLAGCVFDYGSPVFRITKVE